MRRSEIAKLMTAGDQPIVIIICGMPGTRKSSTAVQVAAALDLASVVGMDEVRDVMRLYDDSPMVNGKSHDRWQLFGKLNARNFRRGFLGHCKALRPGALAILRKSVGQGENTVIEGVHLLPSLYSRIKGARVLHFVLTAPGFDEHRRLLNRKFGRRHGRQTPWDDDKVRHLERIQGIMTADAERHGVTIIQSTNPRDNCRRILDLIAAQLQPVVG